MAFLFKFSIIFCTFLLYCASYCVPVENSGGLKIADPTLATICVDFLRQARSRKLFCIICKHFDLSCFVKTTSSPTTSTSPSTTTQSTTTTAQTTTSTTTTPVPTTTASTRTAEENEPE